MIMIAQWIGIKNNVDIIYTSSTLDAGFVITVAVGVMTGTAIGQLSLLWPNFMVLAGNIIDLPLSIEAFAFFFKAHFFRDLFL